jgi:hypothetical protein
MDTRRVLLAVGSVLFGMLACNLPAGLSASTITPAPTAEANLPATITSQASTIEASNRTATPGAEPAATPLAATSSVPEVSVSATTNCRSGPSKAHDLLLELDPGETAEVVGKNTATGYWIIKYSGGTCWLWGQYATVTGDASALAEVAIPTASPSKPAAPTDFVHTGFSCAFVGVSTTLPRKQQIHLEMSWKDMADNEDGYRVYRAGDLIATLPPNATTYIDNWVGDLWWPVVIYSVRAFNAVGESNAAEQHIGCW